MSWKAVDQLVMFHLDKWVVGTQLTSLGQINPKPLSGDSSQSTEEAIWQKTPPSSFLGNPFNHMELGTDESSRAYK